jgi:hypothetical protein
MLVPVLVLAMMQQNVSVCDVQKKPSAYLKHFITIHAQLILALPHGAYLIDKNCRKDILILGYDLPDADETATNLLRSVISDCSPLDHETHGDFTGQIVYSPKGYPELRLKSVSQLSNGPCSPQNSK